MKKTLDSLKRVELSELDIHTAGTWPWPLQALVFILIALFLWLTADAFVLQSMQEDLQSLERQERDLKKLYQKRAFQATNLDKHQEQMKQIEAAFEALLLQLPGETEVPGLLEDISQKALENNLVIESISLKPEAKKEFYAELPFEIRVRGPYHNIGAFISGISGLPRIVTLHDFTLKPVKDGDSRLALSVLAKTYRYTDNK